MTDLLDAWLQARDADALERAWLALPARHVDAPDDGPPAYYTAAGAARLAAAWLGENVAWLDAPPHDMDRAGAPSPVFTTRRAVPRCYLERAIDVREDCNETWTLRELRDGPRVVQWLHVDFDLGDGTRDGRGSGATAVRVADLDAGVGASVLVGSIRATVVARDPSRLPSLAQRALDALDAFEDHLSCELPLPYARHHALAWFAAACAALDPVFTEAPRWALTATPPRMLRDSRGDLVAQDVTVRQESPDDPARAITMRETTPPDAPGEGVCPLSVYVTLRAEGIAGARTVDATLREVVPPRRATLLGSVHVKGTRREVEALRAQLLRPVDDVTR